MRVRNQDYDLAYDRLAVWLPAQRDSLRRPGSIRRDLKKGTQPTLSVAYNLFLKAPFLTISAGLL